MNLAGGFVERNLPGFASQQAGVGEELGLAKSSGWLFENKIKHPQKTSKDVKRNDGKSCL